MRRVLTIFVILVLSITAVFKLMYPVPVFKNFYYVVSVVELALAGMLLFWSNRWRLWSALFLIFFAWGGYALYTTVHGLPCSCMGGEITLPRGLSLLVNLIMIVAAWFVLKSFEKASTRQVLMGFLVFIAGFLSASIVYKYFSL